MTDSYGQIIRNDSDSDNSIFESDDVSTLLNFSNLQRNEQHEFYSLNCSQNDGFSQLLEAINHEEIHVREVTAHDQDKEEFLKKPQSKREKIQEFNEAFTVLKSIERAHEPLSITSVNAFLHYKREYKIDKRTVKGLLWPEHVQTFSDSELLAKEVASLPIDLVSQSETADSMLSLSDDPVSETEEISVPTRLCKISHSTELLDVLRRTCESIWRSKCIKNSDLNPKIKEEIDPDLSRKISTKCSLFLETVFDGLILTRKAALSVLHGTGNFSENITSDWKSVQRASKHILSKSESNNRLLKGLDDRLNKLFSNKANKPSDNKNI